MGCCCLADTTVSTHSRSISGDRPAESMSVSVRVTIVKTGKESIGPHSQNESFSNANFETIPAYDEFSRVFQDLVDRMNSKAFNLNRSRLIEISNKLGSLLSRIQKIIKNPSESKIKDLFTARMLQLNRISKRRGEKKDNKAYEMPNKSNSVIEEKDEELEIEIKENSSQDSSFNRQPNSERLESPLPADFSRLNREKFIIYIGKAKFLESIRHMEHPYIMIKVRPDQGNKDLVTTFETKKVEMKGVPEWQESFCKEFELGRKLDVTKAVFTIELLFFDSKSQLLNSLGENTFSFDEIKSQLVTDKVIKYTRFDKVIAELFFKCQYIFDYREMLGYWERTIKVKKEVADRLILKTHQQTATDGEEEKYQSNGKSLSEGNPCTEGNSAPTKNNNEYNKENSILSVDDKQSLANSEFFDNPFYVKN